MSRLILASCCLCLALLFPCQYAQNVTEAPVTTPQRTALTTGRVTSPQANTTTTARTRTIAPLPKVKQDFLNKELVLAVKANNGTKRVEFLLRVGAEVDYKSGFAVRTPLHIASSVADLKIIQLLLDNGADVNALTIGLATPLHVAATEGRADVVQMLIENGASLTSRTRDGNTPLHWASTQGHSDVVEVLVSAGASGEALNAEDQKPADILCCCECEVPNCTCDDRNLIVELLESSI